MARYMLSNQNGDTMKPTGNQWLIIDSSAHFILSRTVSMRSLFCLKQSTFHLYCELFY